MQDMRVYWDFWGGDAEQTAVHFVQHLVERSEMEGWPVYPKGTESSAPNHCAATMDIPGDMVDTVRKHLRPQRGLPLAEVLAEGEAGGDADKE